MARGSVLAASRGSLPASRGFLQRPQAPERRHAQKPPSVPAGEPVTSSGPTPEPQSHVRGEPRGEGDVGAPGCSEFWFVFIVNVLHWPKRWRNESIKRPLVGRKQGGAAGQRPWGVSGKDINWNVNTIIIYF